MGILVAVSLLGLLTTGGPLQSGDERLSPEHRSWIEDEVSLIVTDRERDFFLSLESVEERGSFIEAFWRRRDPNPVTPENEFRIEHYRRLEFADGSLGDDSFRLGSKTDRGRMFVLLGEPRERQRYDGLNEIVSTELWFYQSEPRSGLPSFFYLVFFKPRDIGEYRLYHPAIDGPRSLLRGRYASLETNDPTEFLSTLNDLSPELARASLSFDPSDPGDYRNASPSLGTDFLLTRIEESPKRLVRTDYLDAARLYGKRVSAEYSFNFVENRSTFDVLFAPDDTALVHYYIEIDPQDFALETDEGQTKFYTTIDLTLEVRDQAETLVYSDEEEAYVELTPSQMENVKSSPFAFQGSFPLVPGDYDVSLILKNRVLKRYTVAEREIRVASEASGETKLSDIVLAFGHETDRDDVGQSFEMGPYRLHPAADHLFAVGETVHVFVQVSEARPSDRVKITLTDGDETIQERERRLSDYTAGIIHEELPLLRLSGGNYQIHAELSDPAGGLTARTSTTVQLSPRTAVARAAYIHHRGFDVSAPGLLALTRGEQFRATRRRAEAKTELEKAVSANNPALPMARWKLASLYLSSGETEPALELLLPIEKEHPDRYEVVAGLGFAFYFQGDYERATDYLDRAVTLRPPLPSLLNALGESYERLGQIQEARSAFERSLKLDPSQKVIEERLGSLSTK